KGPYIKNSYNEDGAFAILSGNARTYWPTTLYELAHETVHMLNPVPFQVNYLEEGFAVLFSMDMTREFTLHPIKPNDIYYREAVRMVRMLDDNPYKAARMIRKKFNALSLATEDQMEELFPNVRAEIIKKLCSTFGS
ncbi:hypothetical protein, partial [Sansalvadorimonas verongulae]|uniref:hypothetical protein n=1 Tax=Sansalvadorimonas verongulae TaxID=2172824 RepID=UPI0018AD2EBE